jgi:hypothetical protein
MPPPPFRDAPGARAQCAAHFTPTCAHHGAMRSMIHAKAARGIASHARAPKRDSNAACEIVRGFARRRGRPVGLQAQATLAIRAPFLARRKRISAAPATATAKTMSLPRHTRLGAGKPVGETFVAQHYSAHPRGLIWSFQRVARLCRRNAMTRCVPRSTLCKSFFTKVFIFCSATCRSGCCDFAKHVLLPGAQQPRGGRAPFQHVACHRAQTER